MFDALIQMIITSINAVTSAISTFISTLGGLVTSMDGLVADQSAPVRKLVSEALDHTAWTDNGDETGLIHSGLTIPAQALVKEIKLEWTEAPTVNGAAGETGITIVAGDFTGGDIDRLGAALSTVIATGLPAEIVDTPVGDAIYSTPTALYLKGTLTGGTPDFGNFINAGGSGKCKVTVIYRDLALI